MTRAARINARRNRMYAKIDKLQAEQPTPFKRGGEWSGTALVGEVLCGYADLVDAFGLPTMIDGDGSKTDAEWVLTFATLPRPTVATIYNYKTGRRYLGPSAPAVETLCTWHVGGHDGAGMAPLNLVRAWLPD